MTGKTISTLIQPFTFVKVTKDDDKVEAIKEGAIVFVAGLQAFPVSEEDPYTQQVLAFTHLTDEDGNILTEPGFFVVHPRYLENLPEEQAELLVKAAQNRAVSIVGEQGTDATTD